MNLSSFLMHIHPNLFVSFSLPMTIWYKNYCQDLLGTYKVHTLYNLFFGYLWFPQLLESISLMTLQTNFASFQPLFHQIFFLPHIFSPLLQLWWHECHILCDCPNSPWVSVHFFFFSQSIFSVLFRLDTSYCFILKFTNSFLLLSFTDWAHQVLNFGYWNFQYWNYHLVFLYIFCFFAESGNFLFFHLTVLIIAY